MTPAEPVVEERNQGEIAASEAELHRLEPEASEADIEDLVGTAYDELMPAKVHSFVPILIVHHVRDILRGRRKRA